MLFLCMSHICVKNEEIKRVGATNSLFAFSNILHLREYVSKPHQDNLIPRPPWTQKLQDLALIVCNLSHCTARRRK